MVLFSLNRLQDWGQIYILTWERCACLRILCQPRTRILNYCITICINWQSEHLTRSRCRKNCIKIRQKNKRSIPKSMFALNCMGNCFHSRKFLSILPMVLYKNYVCWWQQSCMQVAWAHQTQFWKGTTNDHFTIVWASLAQ